MINRAGEIHQNQLAFGFESHLFVVAVIEGNQQQVDRVSRGRDLVADLEMWAVRKQHLVAEIVDHGVGGRSELTQLILYLVCFDLDVEQTGQ